MLSTALTILALGGGTAQRLPDQLDILRGADRTPQVRLLIDMSGSMLTGHQDQTDPCTWYINNAPPQGLQNPSNGNLSRIDQLIAVLTGCRSSDDGILDRWASRMVFGADGFQGSPVNLPQLFAWPSGGLPAYSTNLPSLELAIRGIDLGGNFGATTPLVPGFHQSALRFRDEFNDSNTETCRQNAIVLMTDGQGNSGLSRTFDQVTTAGVPDVTARDEDGCYTPTILPADGFSAPIACGTDSAPPHGDAAASYLWGELGPTGQRHDALPYVSGVQSIRTYTIGFNVPSAASQRLLEDMAAAGGGEYLSATSFQELYDSFERIMTYIRSNAETSFRGITVQGDGLFSGNVVYQNSFQGVEEGHWFGNIKKFCVLPAGGSDDCIFVEGPGGELLVNDDPRDQWSASTSFTTQSGGAGAEIWSQLNPGTDDYEDPVPTGPNAYDGRTIVTWNFEDSPTPGYIEVSPRNAALTPDDTFTLNLCAHYSLLNKLYGYTFDTPSCTPGAADPLAFDFWPLADTINGGQELLRYGEDCDTPGTCYLVTVSNAGMLHIFDAASGQETQAVVPPQFFRPNGVAHHALADLMNQPTLDITRRYFFDGGISVYHDDVDGNGYINASEPAYLIAGFGRGGSAYIKWDVTTLTGGRFTNTANPPHPLFTDRETGFQHLRDTWAAPWVGNFRLPSGDVRAVAVFPTGHQPELDAPNASFASIQVSSPPRSLDSEDAPFTTNCAALGIPAEQCSTPTMRELCEEVTGLGAAVCGTGSGCSPCNLDPDITACVAGGTPPEVCQVNECVAAGFNPPYCYDWPALRYLDPAPLAPWGITGLDPLRISVGPFSYSTPATGPGCAPSTIRGQAYRINFSRFDLQPGDVLAFYDANGIEVERLEGIPGTVPTSTSTGWIRSPEFRMRLITDGNNVEEATGYTISSIDVIRDLDPSGACGDVLPGVYVVDLEEWNGEPGGFAPIPDPGESRQADGLLARFTSDCAGTTLGPDEICVDDDTSAETEDLRYMTCPISAEPAVFTEGGVLRGIYFGDECGQVWSIRLSPDDTSWRVRRLLSTNELDAGFVIPNQESRHYRKIFAPVDLVISTCTGRRALGVYFGTGNLQRPAAIPSIPPLPTDPPRNLESDAVTGFTGQQNGFESDVMGVVWDAPGVPTGGYTLPQLANITTVDELDPTAADAQRGFFQELEEDEKILRAPLVFDGVAFFQSYRPMRAATECDDAVGRSRVYAFDNCTAAPVRTTGPPGPRPDRTILENPNSFIGQGLSVIVPDPDEHMGPMVVGGDTQAGDVADLQSLLDREQRSPVRLLMWRLNVD